VNFISVLYTLSEALGKIESLLSNFCFLKKL
jgi:hypothetical protein